MTRITVSSLDGQGAQELEVMTVGYVLIYEQSGELLVTGNLGKTTWRSLLTSVVQDTVVGKLPSFMKR